MKKNFQRTVAFIMAVLMVFTMVNWSSLTTIVAEAAGSDNSVTFYFYNGKSGTSVGDGSVVIKLGNNGADVKSYTMTKTAPSGAKDTENWYAYTINTNAYDSNKVLNFPS